MLVTNKRQPLLLDSQSSYNKTMREYEEDQMEQAPKKGKKAGILILLGVILLCGGIYLYLNREPVIISPVPSAPNYEVVFTTPTPTVEAPTDTPTPTPKGGKAATPIPTKKVSATGTPAVISKVTATPTPKVTVTPTVKVTVTPTP
ncbi:hypothetical protein A3D77_01030 [Candidatus Gottesmanbacteria bacterium RIFCSPHIGHO2_02_FULL_39_11]|uniref:Uncharacterized protein n=1 Tax=Candidatus Gottesmanbacteria bacterium RIFCSPHIGHO2_02_FULL_39_11 TaxID=1798382 RepID=A0A1F5ZVB6_9BACT|nr:MAG: hypothetical protein A3D77_01030 [Candidatus Gottesmanbacteria bacterium RIFCSPHIGHO2_02_FULL_39_11]